MSPRRGGSLSRPRLQHAGLSAGRPQAPASFRNGGGERSHRDSAPLPLPQVAYRCAQRKWRGPEGEVWGQRTRVGGEEGGGFRWTRNDIPEPAQAPSGHAARGRATPSCPQRSPPSVGHCSQPGGFPQVPASGRGPPAARVPAAAAPSRLLQVGPRLTTLPVSGEGAESPEPLTFMSPCTKHARKTQTTGPFHGTPALQGLARSPRTLPPPPVTSHRSLLCQRHALAGTGSVATSEHRACLWQPDLGSPLVGRHGPRRGRGWRDRCGAGLGQQPPIRFALPQLRAPHV